MLSYTQSAARRLAAATLLGSIVFAGPLAITAGAAPASAVHLGSAPELVAEVSTSPATTEPAPPTEKSDPVEARIRELHNRLHITAAQQTQWDNLVQVMRGNAKTMMGLQKERSQDVNSMTAVDAIKSYA